MYELIKDGKLLKIQEVAAMVNLTQAWIYELIKKGKFPAGKKYGVARLWTGDEVNEWLENREAKRKERELRREMDAAILAIPACWPYGERR